MLIAVMAERADDALPSAPGETDMAGAHAAKALLGSKQFAAIVDTANADNLRKSRLRVSMKLFSKLCTRSNPDRQRFSSCHMKRGQPLSHYSGHNQNQPKSEIHF